MTIRINSQTNIHGFCHAAAFLGKGLEGTDKVFEELSASGDTSTATEQDGTPDKVDDSSAKKDSDNPKVGTNAGHEKPGAAKSKVGGGT